MTKEEYKAAIAKIKNYPQWLLYAKTLYGECRGEPREGKIAVCWVMHRREMDGKLRNDILDPYQFSCYNYGDPNLSKLLQVGIEDKVFQECIDIAFGVLNGNYPDPTNGADHYFNRRLVQPEWAKKMTLVATFGAHEFYKSGRG